MYRQYLHRIIKRRIPPAFCYAHKPYLCVSVKREEPLGVGHLTAQTKRKKGFLMAITSISEQQTKVKNKCSHECKIPRTFRVSEKERKFLIRNIMEGSREDAASILEVIGFPWGVKLKGNEGLFASSLDVKTFLNIPTTKPIINAIYRFGISCYPGYKVMWNRSLLEHPEGLSTETCEGAPKVINYRNEGVSVYCFKCAKTEYYTRVSNAGSNSMYSEKTVVSILVGLCGSIHEDDDSFVQKAFRLVKENPNYTNPPQSESSELNLIQQPGADMVEPQIQVSNSGTVAITAELFQMFIRTAVREAVRELRGDSYNVNTTWTG